VGPTGPTGLVQYNWLSPTGATGTGAGGAGPVGFGGPRGPMGPPAGNYTGSSSQVSNVFYPPTFDPGVYGALYWLPSYGNTGIFVSNGVPMGIAKAGGL